MCRNCHRTFARRSDNGPGACVQHAGCFFGETAQRWLAPGENKGQGGAVSYFWNCCGAADRDAPGCVAQPHVAYDD